MPQPTIHLSSPFNINQIKLLQISFHELNTRLSNMIALNSEVQSCNMWNQIDQIHYYAHMNNSWDSEYNNYHIRASIPELVVA
jgi:hypothetical protein